ncbi:MAG: polyamine aminopropyltransferase [Polyangiales bacterium]
MQALALYLTVLALSTCGLVFELVAATTASYLAGDSVTRFSTVVGAHLSAMGVGAWLTRHVTEQPGRRLLDAQLAAALAGGATAPAVFLAYGRGAWLHGVLYVMVCLTGLFVGAEVPLLLRVLRRRMDVRTLLARVLSVEYAGALVGSLLFALLALPRMGALRAGVAFGLGNALSGFAALRALGPDLGPRDEARRRIYATTAALLLLLLGTFRLSRQADEDVSLGPVLYAEQTHYQRIVVTRQHGGTNLFLDGNLQFASWDEHRYHEALVHPAMAAAPRRARVMILGGGDGLAAREVLRYPEVRAITLVDLDPAMTALARRAPWLRALNRSSMHDPRVRVVNDDAMVWLGRGRDLYDVAVVDFPDPNNFALGKLYTRRFYQLLRARLTPDAVVVVQASSALVARRAYWCVERTMASAGFSTEPYHAFVPSFGEWGYVRASVGHPPPPLGPLPAGLRFLTAEGWRGMTAFPPDMDRVEVQINRLNNQALVRYYETAWHRFTQ